MVTIEARLFALASSHARVLEDKYDIFTAGKADQLNIRRIVAFRLLCTHYFICVSLYNCETAPVSP